MNQAQFNRMKNGKGFIAALDQSGGSTPKALKLYGISEDRYGTEEEMFKLVHQMRTRIITSPSFTSKQILGAILFKVTMESKIKDLYSADYLWKEKGIVPFLKVDSGLAEEQDGVQMMKPIPDLDALLKEAKKKNIFGTKMRSVIKHANPVGIKAIVSQQFELARRIMAFGLVPIIEPEVDIHASDKQACEELLLADIKEEMAKMKTSDYLIFKLTIPTVPNFYKDLMVYPDVVRVVALSGGYPQQEAVEKLSENNGMVASFSRALSEGLKAEQSQEEFDAKLADSVKIIYEASLTDRKSVV